LTPAPAGGEWSASRPGLFTPKSRASGTHWIGGWVDPRAGVDDLEKRKFWTLQGLELRPLGRPARSQSLYRLSYPGSPRGAAADTFIALSTVIRAKREKKHPFHLCRYFRSQFIFPFTQKTFSYRSVRLPAFNCFVCETELLAGLIISQ
jgi:hypothetical protein